MYELPAKVRARVESISEAWSTVVSDWNQDSSWPELPQRQGPETMLEISGTQLPKQPQNVCAAESSQITDQPSREEERDKLSTFKVC